MLGLHRPTESLKGNMLSLTKHKEKEKSHLVLHALVSGRTICAGKDKLRSQLIELLLLVFKR